MNLKEKLLARQETAKDPLGLISEERMLELREQARENVKKRLAKKAEDAFLKDEEIRLEREANPRPEYEMRSIVIDAADHTNVIRIDNQHYFYGQRYEVPLPVYTQLLDIISRGWRHEKEISSPTARMFSNNRGVVLHGADNGGGTRF